VKKGIFARILAAALSVTCAIGGPGITALAGTVNVSDELSYGEGAEKMGDRYDKSNTLTGIIYNELRAKELGWADEMRNYGTKKMNLASRLTDSTLDINMLNFTERRVNARQYAMSNVGTQDLLGPWTVVDVEPGLLDTLKTWLTEEEGAIEGILGPTPFKDAEAIDYKILRSVDIGNELELRGKPQEGFTSNAKVITAMASVFYQQTVDELKEDILSSDKGLHQAFQTAKYCWKMAWTKAETHDIPFLAEIARFTGWSWTSTYRNYAYPLMEASHQANFFLNSYIYPTRWTMPDEGSYRSISEFSHWDGHLGTEEGGNQEIKVGQNAYYMSGLSDSEVAFYDPIGQEAKNGRLGTPKESGSGKVTHDAYVSNETYNGQGDAEWEFIEKCPSDIYNGFGCQLRCKFYYKWPARDGVNTFTYAWSTDPNEYSRDTPAHLIEEQNAYMYNRNMYYGENPDGTTPALDTSVEADPNTVAPDVSPWYEESDEAQGFHKNNCLIHFFLLHDETPGTSSYCWLYEGGELGDANMPVVVETFPGGDGSFNFENTAMKMYEFKGSNSVLNSQRISKFLIEKCREAGFADNIFNSEIGYIQQIDIDESGVTLWVSVNHDREIQPEIPEKFPEPIEFDPYTGDPTLWSPYQPYQPRIADWRVKGFKVHFTHQCLGLHEGIYCAGHLQLRTRGVVYGMSKEQMLEGEDLSESSNKAALFTPKFLDDYTDLQGNVNEELANLERSLYPELSVFNVNDHVSEGIFAGAGITDEDMETIYEQKDIFDIDVLIKRKLKSYPGYPESQAIEKMKSWTMNNMLNAMSLASTDWGEAYNLADTQAAVGGIYDSVNPQQINALNDSVKQTILSEYTEDKYNISVGLDLTKFDDPYKKVDGTPLTDEEKMTAYRLRHVMYALNCVGKVGYAQTRHDGMYENIAGKATDCSGFVSNIWRDVFDTSLTTSQLYEEANAAHALHHYTGLGTPGIKPGDIVLRKPMDEDAHALLYIGKFDKNIIYSVQKDTGEYAYNKSGEEKVYTVDCSSMILNEDDLPDSQTPVASTISSIGSGLKALVNWLKGGEAADTSLSKVRSGNTRFCAREYMTLPDTSDMYYIDMEQLLGSKLQNVLHNGRYMKADSFEHLGLGDSVTAYWDSYTTNSDVSEDARKSVITLHYDEETMKGLKPKKKLAEDFVHLDEEMYPEDLNGMSEEELDEFLTVVDGMHMLNASSSQYINQGRQNPNIKDSYFNSYGCCAFSYLMALSVLKGKSYANDPVAMVKNDTRKGAGGFVFSEFLRKNDCTFNRSFSYSRNSIQKQIDAGHPVVIGINGSFDFHPRNSSHFMLIIGYNEKGYVMFDPGNWQNTYSQSGKVISYSSIENNRYGGRVTETNAVSLNN